MAAKETPVVKELRNASKRFFLDPIAIDELMQLLRSFAADTIRTIRTDPELWGKIRTSLTVAERKRNYLRFVEACRAYAAETETQRQ